jgi:hypothetical protein
MHKTKIHSPYDMSVDLSAEELQGKQCVWTTPQTVLQQQG